MQDKLHKILKKKKDISENEKKAKMDVVKSLRDDMSGMMGDKLNKISVLSNSKQGLKKGLDKAQDVLGNMDESSELKDAENPYHDSDMARENNHPGLNRQESAYADGGEVKDDKYHLPEGNTGKFGPIPMDGSEYEGKEDEEDDEDSYSEGGQVSDDESGEDESEEAGESAHEDEEMHDLDSIEQKIQELEALKEKMKAMHRS